MAIPDWKDTALWQWLERRGEAAEATRAHVLSWLPDIQLLLSKGDTAPLDFTLHDDGHSFRVAERMAQLIPANTAERLSDFEIGLLLEAAYLHDVGMNPRRPIVQRIRNFLLTGLEDDGAQNEMVELQRWLDESHPSAQPPIDADRSITERIASAEFLTAHFCRHRHNDWSAEYISLYSQVKSQRPYANWVEDLATLCRSHHYSFEELMDSEFDLRIVGVGNALVNLRYLAAVLRLADVLEFDPERTPPIVFQQRGISPSSRIYWHKDHDIALAIQPQFSAIRVTARTKNAWTHRAVLVTADDIDRELQICAGVETQNGFAKGVKLESPTHYSWPWSNIVVRDVRPVGNSFEYIDGTFRPNAARILSLLGGTALYGTPFAAVRELLQNAFDAIAEQIAYEALAKAGIEPSVLTSSIAALNFITLNLDKQADGVWLVCSDTGTGMTRRIIERYLLVSGSNQRPELLDVVRRCEARGVQFNRSGEFGVGVLSYFMLADKMIIETRASVDAHADAEHHGWRFETEGLDAFGELRAIPMASHGTTVRLRLKADVTDGVFETDLLRYLRTTVSKSPCVLNVKFSSGSISIPPGWASNSDFLAEASAGAIRTEAGPRPLALKSQRLTEAETETRNRWDKIRENARQAIRYSGPIERTLPDAGGTLRMHIPYFVLGDCPSTAFFDIKDDVISALPDGRIGMFASGARLYSWRKFSAPAQSQHFGDRTSLRNSVVEIDLERNASISLNRTQLSIKNNAALHEFVQNETHEAMEDAFSKLGGSRYIDFDQRWARSARSRGLKVQAYWGFPEPIAEEEEAPTHWIWRQIRFPAIVFPDAVNKYSRRIEQERLQREGYVDQIYPIRYHYSELMYPISGVNPKRIAILSHGYSYQVVLVYEDDYTIEPFKPMSAQFPEEWQDVLAIQIEGAMVYNNRHKIYNNVTDDDWNKYWRGLNLVDVEDRAAGDIDNSIGSLSTFILRSCGESTEFWNAVRDNLPAKFQLAMDLVETSDPSGAFKIWKDTYSRGLRTVSRGGAVFQKTRLLAGNELPMPQNVKFFIA